MTMDDDDLEDPALGSLRSVLRGMRDEEPSDRGLASLMAAARVQAEVMKPAPAWWERVLATLRRPPVLALASAALLVSGGLVISRHARELDATSPAPAASAPTEDTPEPAATLAGSAAVAAPGGGALDPPPTPGAAATLTSDTTAASAGAPESARAPRPAPKATTAPVMPTTGDAIIRDDARGLRRGTGTSSRPADLAPEAVRSPTAAPVPDEAEADATEVEGGRDVESSDERARPVAAPTRPRAASTTQIQDWVTRCEQAAVRGDCATVRSLARQVEAAAPSVFRSRLVVNGAVARCLAP